MFYGFPLSLVVKMFHGFPLSLAVKKFYSFSLSLAVKMFHGAQHLMNGTFVGLTRTIHL